MLCVAICDDELDIRRLLQAYLKRYAEEKHMDIRTILFSDGIEVEKADLSSVDLLILDIQMPKRNGLDAARTIRRRNQSLPIIFFTNYVQYALEGYEVQAFRFLLKPLDYSQFSNVVGKALAQINQMHDSYLVLHANDEMIRLPIGEITYVETDRGRILIHHRGQITSCRSTMQSIESTLIPHHFFRCHKAYIVSLREIQTVRLTDIILSDHTVIPISKHRKKELKENLAIYWGEQFL